MRLLRLLIFLLCLPLIVAMVDRSTVSAAETNTARPVLPQANPSAYQSATCSVLVEQALTALGNNCAAMEGNSACYGFNRVEASFFERQSEGFFSQPADRASLSLIETLRTAPLNTSDNSWGIAVLNVQANVPNTLPGQNVVFLLVGDAEVSNGVPPENAAMGGGPVPVTTLARTNLHTGPALNTNVVMPVESGQVLPADAVSPDGGWLRVVFNESPGWVNRAVVSNEAGLASLPTLSPESRTPMQAFYFTPGVTQPECQEAPNLLAIQSPNGITIDLTLNGANVRLGSLITLRYLDSNTLAITVHEGSLETEVGVIAIAGETIVAQVDANGNIVSWQVPRPATEEELAVGRTIGQAYQRLSGQTIISTTTQPDACAGPITHTVQRGQNLYRIALQYDTSISSIVAANGIGNVIYAGQQLIIPTPCSGFVNDFTPPVQQPVLPPNQSGFPTGTTTVDCGGFRPTSPLDGLPYGNAAFYWDGAPGATSYSVTIFNNANGRSVTYSTSGAETTLTGAANAAVLGDGFDFSWQVTAFANGVPICTTNRVNVPRAARGPSGDPAGGSTTPTCSVSANCNCNNICEPSYPFDENNSLCPSDCP